MRLPGEPQATFPHGHVDDDTRTFPNQPMDSQSRARIRRGDPCENRAGSVLRRGLVVSVLLCLVSTGCAEKSIFRDRSSSPSQLKVSLSRLQFDNEQLKTEVTKLKQENRSMEDRLVQEQLHNGDLTARLDDARNLLRDRGIDSETRVGSRSAQSRESDPDEALSRPRTLPAGRTTRKPRKPPAAHINGDLDALPTASEESESRDNTISFRAEDDSPRRRRFPDEDAIRFDDDSGRWHPAGSSPASGKHRQDEN